jgi:uncharacterized SAM-binding protein YcdF (DUF218 family)
MDQLRSGRRRPGATTRAGRRRPRPWVTVLGVVLALVLVWSLPRLGSWLSVGQSPEPAGAIIVLGGGITDRLHEGVRLWKQGYAPLLVLSGGAPGNGPLTQAQSMAVTAKAMGVPPYALVLDNRSHTTFQNALDTLPLLQARHVTSALVVSSDYHMRRARFLFLAVYRGSGIRLRFVGVRSPSFDPGRWWATPASAYITLSEYAKLAVNVLEVGFWEATHG